MRQSSLSSVIRKQNQNEQTARAVQRELQSGNTERAQELLVAQEERVVEQSLWSKTRVENQVLDVFSNKMTQKDVKSFFSTEKDKIDLKKIFPTDTIILGGREVQVASPKTRQEFFQAFEK